MTETIRFAHEIRVGWGQCDPAKIAYTGWIPMWALESIDAWWEAHLGGGWYQLEIDRNIGTPFVHLSMDFVSPVTPRHRLICEVWPVKLGETSITFAVIGRQNGTECFKGRFVSVFTVADKFRKQPAPDEIKTVIGPLLRPIQ